MRKSLVHDGLHAAVPPALTGYQCMGDTGTSQLVDPLR